MASGVWLFDTQTGLRGFPASLLARLTRIEGERYEYEMNMLLICAGEGVHLSRR